MLPSLFAAGYGKGPGKETDHITPHFLPSEADYSVWKLLQLPALSWDPLPLPGGVWAISCLQTGRERQKANSHRRLPDPTHACREEC